MGTKDEQENRSDQRCDKGIMEKAVRFLCRAAFLIFFAAEKADASSIIDILTLACSHGTTIKIEITDHEDTVILDNIASLFETSFGE